MTLVSGNDIVLESRVQICYYPVTAEQALGFGFFPKISTTVEKIVENAGAQSGIVVFGPISLGFACPS